MSRKVTFHRLASRELNDAAQYYESTSAGLGEAFLQEIERCIRHIVLYPRAGAVLGGEVRRWLARAFPYAVIYRDGLVGRFGGVLRRLDRRSGPGRAR